MNGLGQIAILLVKPKAPGNVGSAARALKNMGLSDLRVVAPRDWDLAAAKVMAVHASDLLERARFFPSLLEALHDRTLTVGTTARSGPYRSEVRPLREATSELALATATNRLAIVFGPEDQFFNRFGEMARLLPFMTVRSGSESGGTGQFVSAPSFHHRQRNSRRSGTYRDPTRVARRPQRCPRWRRCDPAEYSGANQQGKIRDSPC